MSASADSRPLLNHAIALGVTGSIAAYKAAMLTRLLLKAGAEVQVLMTRAATQFVGEATFAGLTGTPVLTRMFDPDIGGELHVDLASESDAVVIAPATADLIARAAGGRADDAVGATLLSASCPVLLAPAMHPAMWSHPATQRNVATLRADGRAEFVGPVSGEVASGDHGVGRMAEPEDILNALIGRLTDKDLSSTRILVTAGPTLEDLDPVRTLTNRSTGRMGYALAERAALRGAEVDLVSGPVQLSPPPGVRRTSVRSALDMQAAIDATMQEAPPDVVIMTAAVGDYRPKEASENKHKRSSSSWSVDLVPNPDVLKGLGEARKGSSPVLIGFAVETLDQDALVVEARRKLTAKKVDLVVANHAKDAFGRPTNVACLVGKTTADFLPELPKAELADRILDWLVKRLSSNQGA